MKIVTRIKRYASALLVGVTVGLILVFIIKDTGLPDFFKGIILGVSTYASILSVLDYYTFKDMGLFK